MSSGHSIPQRRYAQDKNGNVCYLGEDTKEFDATGENVVSTEGSWQSGKNGAHSCRSKTNDRVNTDGIERVFERDVVCSRTRNTSLKLPCERSEVIEIRRPADSGC
jgi:hypothetical protein